MGERVRVDEATFAPPQRLPYDETNWRVEAILRRIMATPVFGDKDRD